jgi:hypothetical protein
VVGPAGGRNDPAPRSSSLAPTTCYAIDTLPIVHPSRLRPSRWETRAMEMLFAAVLLVAMLLLDHQARS